MLNTIFAISFTLLTFSAFGQADVNTSIQIMQREEWKALPPKFDIPSHTPKFITIHHTGVKKNPDVTLEQKLRNLQAFSISNDPLADGTPRKGWADVPYHFYIDMEGKIAEGRKVTFQGDSNTKYDLDGHVSIVLEGNFEMEEVSPEQLASLQDLIFHLSEQYALSPTTLSGHLDQAMTSCPGKNLYNLIPQLKSEL
ncbi:peptidoglycan recognition protein family protein [Litoribacter populi]|uniref:peptidoglycan recognition protein family protein n=1 Tax=Litoribacter populi TaxID=2598460 RepID=UPI00117D2C22|nr:peptidoglycan recognition family protein [Litoribacter populi]